MKTVRQIEIEEDLRTRHGGLLTFAEVSEEIGIKHKDTVNGFLNGLPVYRVEGKRRWRTADIARHLASMEVTK